MAATSMLMAEGISPPPLGEALVGWAASGAGPEAPQSTGLREEHRGGPLSAATDSEPRRFPTPRTGDRKARLRSAPRCWRRYRRSHAPPVRQLLSGRAVCRQEDPSRSRTTDLADLYKDEIKGSGRDHGRKTALTG